MKKMWKIILFGAYLHSCFLESNVIAAQELLQTEGEILNECPKENSITLGSRYFLISFEKNCSEYSYLINAKEKSSIIEIIITSQISNDDTQTTHESISNVTVTLQERMKRNTTDAYTSETSWSMTSNQHFKKILYSRTSNIRVTINKRAIISRMEAKVEFKELTFETVYKNSSEDDIQGMKPWISAEGRSYRPNCVYVFRILKPENLTMSNVMITLHSLDIDEEMGEYLLIGAGLDPFEGPPPFFILQIYGTKKYLVNDENAYVVFTTASTRADHKGFYITWKHSGKKIEKKEEISNEDVDESLPICIYNITAALEEFNKTEGWFEEFYTNLAVIATKYARDNLSMNEEKNISSSSISIFHVSGIFPVDDLNQALHARVKISEESEKGKAAFKRYELQRILEKYTEKYSNNGIDVLQIRVCPTRKMLNSWKKLSIYLTIPVICCGLLLMWTWKYNPVLEYFARKNRRKRASRVKSTNCDEDDCSSISKSISQNAYSSLPKLQVTNDSGRRHTLYMSDALLGDAEQSEDEIFNRMASLTQNGSHIQTSQRNRRSSKHPEINQAFELEEFPETQGQEEEKNEQMYDTVKSSSSLTDTRL